MRCFNHPDTEAVGMCKACCKGLCPTCAADLGHGIACKSTHVELVESLNMLITRNANIQNVNSKNKFVVPGLYAFMGLVFLGYGVFSSKPLGLPTIMGAGFMVFAAVMFGMHKRAFRK